MKAFILAAGLGTRLKPLTDSMPKALVPYGGIPLLERQILRLKEEGITRFVINVHHFADMVEEFLRSKGNFGCDIAISDERDLLRETGGAIRHASPLLQCGEGQTVLVHNVDIISDIRYTTLNFDCQAVANLIVSQRKTNRYLLFDKQMRLKGWTNVATGEVRIPDGKTRIEDCLAFAFSGIHLIGGEMLSLMESWPEKFPVMEFYLSICADHLVRGIDVTGSSITDVGKIAELVK